MKYKHLSDDELQELITANLDGDIQAGDTIIKQYDSLIKKSILNYFKQYDLHIGWSVEDIQQQTRLNILKSLKSFRFDKCSFPYWLVGKCHFCCNRFLRYSRQLKRNHQSQCDYDITLAAHIPDHTIKQPDQIAVESEFWDIIEQRISTLDAVCKAIYEVAIEEREGIYNSSHPLLKNLGGGSMYLRLGKVREAVREVLSYYHAN